MKLLILSDLHIEFAPFAPVDTDADVVVLAGDVGLKLIGIRMAQRAFAERPVVYVAGNHEYYGGAIPHLTEKMRAEASGSNVHFLENDEIVIDGVRFLGCTLWTDFALLGPEERDVSRLQAEDGMTDYRRIRLSPRFRKLQTRDTWRFHLQSLQWLERALQVQFEGPTVVVTHHAPAAESILEKYRGDRLSPAYASDLTHFVRGKPIDLWIHGHTHTRRDYQLEGIRVVSNQRGYADELVPDFDPAFTVEIG